MNSFLTPVAIVFTSLLITACGGGLPPVSPDPVYDGSTNNPNADTDGDGVKNSEDVFPSDASESKDSDEDGVGDNGDAFPNDASESKDSDEDGVGDNEDVFPNDASESKDSDEDGVGDNKDVFPNDASKSKDSDEDGVGDNEDAFPNDASESKDSDEDGVGDNKDVFPNDASESKDSDEDGVGDNEDAFPNDASESKDSDEDGVGDNEDTFPNDTSESKDSDEDGVGDNEDAFPNDANESKDSDEDAVGDNSDTCPNTEIGEPSNQLGCSASQLDHARCKDNVNTEGGRSYQVVLPFTDNDGFQQRISFQVMEPTNFDCDNFDNGAHPLMMHGPGYSSSRAESGFLNYRDDGYTVISWDPRGFGDSSGSVKAMNPEYEGRYLIEVLDWIEQNLDYLAWRNESTKEFILRPIDGISRAGGDNLVVGSQGGSYGGAYQLLLISADPKKRLDAIAPDITWHDMRAALNPRDVIKTAWGSLLAVGGTSTGYTSLLPLEYLNEDNLPEEPLNAYNDVLDNGPDPFIQETLTRALATNEWPRQSLDWFEYAGGFGAWCKASGLSTLPYPSYGTDIVPMIDVNDSDNTPDKDANDNLSYGDYLVDPDDPNQYFNGLEVLLTQGMTDPLFHFNQAWWNRQCLSEAGANVSLYTHNKGHPLPAQFSDKEIPDTGDCGFYSSDEQKSWFDKRLNPLSKNMFELPGNTAKDTCFALGTVDYQDADGMPKDDTVKLDVENVLAPGASDQFTERQITTPATVPNGPAGFFNLRAKDPVVSSFGKIQVENGAILAGIPHLNVSVTSLAEVNEEAPNCNDPEAQIRTGCDSITFVGMGKKLAGDEDFTLIDGQLQPIRGLGVHNIDLVGIAERLNKGDELAVLFYAVHPQFASSASRDLTIPAVNISGSILLPLYVSGDDDQPIVGANTELVLPEPTIPESP
jgi:pimeloyl-ACP methyl ester carboxylesterase